MVPERFGDVLCVIGDLFADGANLHLHGSEPERKRSRVMLDQNAEEAFHGAEQRAVHHKRLVLRAVLGDVLQAKTRGQIEIKLHGGELPGTADGVNQLDVDFRAVECRFALDFLERNVHVLHGVRERSAGTLPVFGLASVILRMRGIPVGKLHLELIKAEILHHSEGEIHASFHFRFDLRRHAENVGVVLRKAADAQQAVQHSAALVAVNSPEFREAHGQIAIAMQLGLVNENVARAVHGLELVIGLLHFDRAEHAVPIKAGVPAGLPEIEPHDVRCVNEIVAAFEKLVAQPVFDDFANQPALGMPENQSRTGFFLDAEEIQLDAQLAMIAALGLFDAMEMFVQFFLREKRDRVYALKLRIAFLTLPVSARHVH